MMMRNSERISFPLVAVSIIPLQDPSSAETPRHLLPKVIPNAIPSFSTKWILAHDNPNISKPVA